MGSKLDGILIQNLSKQYRGTNSPALCDLTLHIQPGEIYGFLGPNGAGKSTTIRLLLNFLRPTSGTATINGFDIEKDSVQIRNSLGYLSGDMALYPKLTGKQYLQFACELQGLSSEAYKNELIKKLHPDLDKKMGELSRGNKQKIGIIQALMHKPEVIIFDEPTTGLDPLMQEVFFSILKDAKARNATIFVSSHVLGEVQKMCDRVGIIRQGKLVGEKNIKELANEATHTFDIEFADKIPLGALRKIDGLKIKHASENKVTLHFHGKLKNLLAVLSKYDVIHIDTRSLDLEEEFMHYYSEGQRS